MHSESFKETIAIVFGASDFTPKVSRDYAIKADIAQGQTGNGHRFYPSAEIPGSAIFDGFSTSDPIYSDGNDSHIAQ